ncbi:MAG TPA: hypothetical protein VE263_22810 [Candidatus Angelobacter sp.]|nr:hypothetical protein [Candidatus Angelobacter sp.]
MLTLFTTAKPFRGHEGVIQRNALRSWTLLRPDAEVILFGDEEGARETALELGLRHEPQVERNEFGTKRLDAMFLRAQEIARHELLAYINCDILLMADFCAALKCVRAAHRQFLMVGRRWDLEIGGPLSLTGKDWEARLRERALRGGRRRGPEWIDYFVFTRGLYEADVPPFVVGRVFWDNWLVWKARDAKHPVVDASAAVVAVHQNHDYGYHPQGRTGVFQGTESGRNYELAGGWKHLRTIADATELLREDKLCPNRLQHWSEAKRYARQAARMVFHGGIQRAWFFFLSVTRPTRRRLGLRAENLRQLRKKTLLVLGRQP